MTIDSGSIIAKNSNGVFVNKGKFQFYNGSITTQFSSDSSFPRYAILTQNKGEAELDNINVTFDGNGNGNAVKASSDSTINAKNLTVDFHTDTGNSYGLVSFGTINLSENTTIIGASATSAAMLVEGSQGKITTNTVGSKMNILGSIYAQNGGVLDLNMLSGSTLTGAIQTSDASSDITMTNSHWNMSDDSQITNFVINNSSIDFLSHVADYKTLTINHFSGSNNTFGLNFNLGGITSDINENNERVGISGVNGDLITVTDSVSPNQQNNLEMANNGSEVTQGNEVLQVVKLPNNSGGLFSLSHPVEAGAYEYGLRQSKDIDNNETGWELYSTGKTTTTAKASLSFINANYLLNYVDTQTLLERLGELRRENRFETHNNLWIKSYGGLLNHFRGEELNEFNMSYFGMQLGMDKQVFTNYGMAYIGGMVGSTQANPDYTRGGGHIKGYNIGLYGTLIGNNGLYIDSIIKYSRLNNKFNVDDSQGSQVKGDDSADGYSVSLELGKRFYIDDSTAKNGIFYIEPQGQITYGHQGSMQINASNGLKVDLDSYNYTLARVSGIFGYEMTKTNPINLYFKTGYVRELIANTSYKFNGIEHQYHVKDGWWDNAVGLTAQIQNNHNIYADFTHSIGGRFNKKQVNLGYRYNF